MERGIKDCRMIVNLEVIGVKRDLSRSNDYIYIENPIAYN